MGRENRYLLGILLVGIVGVYFLTISRRPSAENEAVSQASKKLQAYARHVVSAEPARAPASASEPTKTSRDRFVESYFGKANPHAQAFDLKGQRLKVRAHEREIAQKLAHGEFAEENVAIIRELKAIPRAQLEEDSELARHATVLNPQWAIFNRQQLPSGNPVVYNFESDQWGVLTGMVQVDVPDASQFEDTVSDIQARGYQVVRLPESKEAVYVLTGSKSVDGIEKVSKELKSVFGNKVVKPETLYVWRSPQ